MTGSKETKASSKTKAYSLHAKIQWKWLGRVIQGEVQEVFTKPTVKVIKEKKIKRIGSPENPAYLVKSESGNLALKLHSELSAQPKKTEKAARPKMFSDQD